MRTHSNQPAALFTFRMREDRSPKSGRPRIIHHALRSFKSLPHHGLLGSPANCSPVPQDVGPFGEQFASTHFAGTSATAASHATYSVARRPSPAELFTTTPIRPVINPDPGDLALMRRCHLAFVRNLQLWWMEEQQ